MAEDNTHTDEDEEICLGCGSCYGAEGIQRQKAWIGCDACWRWYHYWCAGMSRKPRKNTEFLCDHCTVPWMLAFIHLQLYHCILHHPLFFLETPTPPFEFPPLFSLHVSLMLTIFAEWLHRNARVAVWSDVLAILAETPNVIHTDGHAVANFWNSRS